MTILKTVHFMIAMLDGSQLEGGCTWSSFPQELISIYLHPPYRRAHEMFSFSETTYYLIRLLMCFGCFFSPTGDHVAKTLDPPSSLRADHLPDIHLRGSSVQVGTISSKSVECQQGEIL